MRELGLAALIVGSVVVGGIAQQRSLLQPADFYKLQSIGDVELSPTGADVAYSVVSNSRPGRPTSSTWLRELASGTTVQLENGAGPRWSPDGQSIAYFGRSDEGAGLMVATRRGETARFIAPVGGTNHPLPSSGEALAWSPDGRRIAYVSAVDGPESKDADGDPMVITRYLYKPTAAEGLTRFNDNKRVHIFVAEIASRTVRQLTSGAFYEHSIDWSPKGDEIAFVSNREANADRVFNYDIFAVNVSSGAIRRLTSTKSAEYAPVFSPDGSRVAYAGTTRDLTSSETTMEDTHVWVMRADGSEQVEVGKTIDNRQGSPQWSPDGQRLLFWVQERGSTKLVSVGSAGTGAATLVGERGSLGAFSVGKGALAYALTTPASPAELYLASEGGASPQLVTSLNQPLLADRQIADVESLSFTNDGLSVEAFLTIPPAARTAKPGSVPLIVMIHGGPHGQQGPAFNAKAQAYAGVGWASLMVNYRGSTGYGQKFIDAIFRDQNGGEAKDVVAGVDAALAKYPWLDGARLGIEGTSYGGQLTNWIITQTPRFKAAVPAAGISNLVTQNYLAYYHDYLAVEYGGFPHERVRNDPQERMIIDMLWERSAIRYANKVKTPVLFVHGENDNDVPIEEAEQYFIGLLDNGVEAVMLRYPREGHGLRETGHVVDALERSIAWYKKHFRTTR
ncbi:MAG TPA: S9 family peptidase [Vicinamibacterales bacterium]|nr:S9 family peptidase [Vicinamibacterales bacterium]